MRASLEVKDAPARSIETPTAVIARAIVPHDRRLAMTRYESRDGRLRLFRGDSHRLHPITSESVGVILTSPPYWVRGRGQYVTLLGMLAATSSKIGREIYTLMKQEFGEVEELFG